MIRKQTHIHRTRLWEHMEDRILFDAVLGGDLAEATSEGAAEDMFAPEMEADVSSGEIARVSDTVERSPVQPRRELVLVDTSVENYRQLVDDILGEDDPTRDIEVLKIDGSTDGVQAISNILDGYSGLDAVHLVSHGTDSAVQLGNAWLSVRNVGAYAGQITQWANAFSSDGDILLYGCHLGDSAEGQQLVESISSLTQTDVAASTDDTGYEPRGGDWDLEYAVGPIETNVAFSQALRQSWNALLAVGPDAQLSLPTNVPLGEDFTFTVTFDNTGNPGEVGYGPFIDLIFPVNGADGAAGTDTPDGLDFVGATYFGAVVNAIEFVFPDDDGAGPGTTGTVTHPFAVDATGAPLQVTGTAGDKLVVLELPFGAFTPEQPSAPITINATSSNLADVGTPLTIAARAGFRYGADPLDNPTSDPSILSDTQTDSSAWGESATITPILFTMTKTEIASESETVTGPNYVCQYQIDIDIADGQTIADFDITDDLPNNIVFQSLDTLTSSDAGTTFTENSATLSTTQPFNSQRLLVNADTVTGIAGTDITIVYSFYVPEFDADGLRIIPIDGEDDLTASVSTNTANALGDFSPIDTRDAGGTDNAAVLPAQATVDDKAIAIQKTVAVVDDTGSAGATPGDTLEYTLTFQISDYYTFGDLIIDDIFQDGQLFDFAFGATLDVTDMNGNTVGSFTVRDSTAPDMGETLVVDQTKIDRTDDALEDPVSDGSTTLAFDLSQTLLDLGEADGVLQGGLTDGPANGGSTTGTIRFRTVIQDEFADTFPSGDRSVDQSDLISNTTLSISGTVRENEEDDSNGTLFEVIGPAPDGYESDTSSAETTIVRGDLDKDVYAINGSTTLPIGSNSEVLVRAGDVVTYQILYTLPTSDFDDLLFTDYLPMPVFDVDDVDGDDVMGDTWTFDLKNSFDAIVPMAGNVEFGPSDTFFNSNPGFSDTSSPGYYAPPQLTVDGTANSVEIEFGTYDDPAHPATTIDLLFSVVVQDAPMADGLFLSNIIRAEEGSTNQGVHTNDQIAIVELTEPELSITKGAVSTSSIDGTFSPSPTGPVTFESPGSTNPAFIGPIDSTTLAADPIDSNIDNVDAADLVKFAIVIENTGNADAYDLIIADLLAAGFQIPTNATGLNLEIRDGDGNLMQWTGVDTGADSDLFGGGIEIYDPIRVYLASDATDELTMMPSRDDFDPTTNEQIVGPLGASNVEAMALNPVDGVLYAADADTLGRIDLATGTFTAVGGTFGTGSGSLGNVTFSDVDALAFNPLSGELYGVHWDGAQNAIFKIDTATGTFVSSAFGTDDYIALNNGARLDDIAIDKTGTIYGSDAENLLRIDLDEANATGTVTTIGAHGVGVDDMEGLSIDEDGRLWGTTGNTCGITNSLWEVDKTTGAASNPRSLDDGGDYEASEAYFPGSLGAIDDVGTGGGSNIIIITYDLETTTAVEPNQTYTNTATLVNYASRDGGEDFAEPDLTDTATTTIDDPAFVKTLMGSGIDDANNASNEAVVGELVTYEIVIDVPEGTMNNFQVQDLLDSGLAFVGASVSATAGLSTSTGTFADVGNNATAANQGGGVQNDGRLVTFDFGTVTNSDTNDGVTEQITITYQAVVVNATNVDAGDSLNNSATLTWEDGSANDTAANITILEPTVTVQKTASVPQADVGDTVTFTVLVTNTGGANGADAFEVELSDVLPSGFTYVGGTLTHDAGVAPTTLNESGGTITADWSTLAFGQSSTISFDATGNASFSVAGETNVVNTEWTSLPGDVTTTRSAFNTLAVERTGDAADPAQAPADNDYNATDSAFVDFPLAPSKTITSTSEAHTSDATADTVGDPRPVAIGEIASYELRMQVGEGTLNGVIIRDLLTNGMTLLPDTVTFEIIADANMTVPGDLTGANSGSITLPAGRISVTPGATQTIDFDLGTITNNDSDIGSEELVITFDALVSNTTVNNDGDVKTNSFDFIENGAVQASSNTVYSEIVEPNISDVNKQVVTTNGDGTQVTYEVTFSNTGNASAMDAVVLDSLAAELTLQAGTIAVATTGTVNGIDTSNSTGWLLDIRIDEIGAGATVTTTYTVDVAFAGAAIENKAEVTYTSLPGTNGTGSTTPGGPGDADGERTGSGIGTNDYLDSDDAFLGSIGDRIWYDVDADGVQDAGEPGIPCVTANLVWFGPDGVLGGGDDVNRTTATDASGGYTFSGVPAGNYTISVDTDTLPSGVAAQTFDLDGIATASTTNTSLADSVAGIKRTDVDFGYASGFDDPIPYRFDSFNDHSAERKGLWEKHERADQPHTDRLLTKEISNLAPEPIFSGSARPGTQIVGRAYNSVGVLIGEEISFADVGGNWMMQFHEIASHDHARFEFVELAGIDSTFAPRSDSYGYLGIDARDNDYAALEPWTPYGESHEFSAVYRRTAGQSLMALHRMHQRPIGLGSIM